MLLSLQNRATNRALLSLLSIASLACGASGDSSPDARRWIDAAAVADAGGPDADSAPFSLAGCSPTPGDVVTMYEGDYLGAGVSPDSVYLFRRQMYGVGFRTYLYTAPRTGGLAMRLVDTSDTGREIKSDGERLYVGGFGRGWHSLRFDGLGDAFLNGFTSSADLELVDGIVYVTGERDGQWGLWQRPSAFGGGNEWVLVAAGPFGAPLDIASGYAVTGGGDPEGHTDGSHVHRVRLSDGEAELMAWGREPISSMAVDGDGVYWTEPLDDFRLTAPIARPTFLFSPPWGGASNLQATATHVDFAHSNNVGRLIRYDRTTKLMSDVFEVPFLFGRYLAVGDDYFLPQDGFSDANPGVGGVYRYDVTKPAEPPTKLPVPMFDPHTLVTDGEYVYWTDQGDFGKPGAIWRTRIDDNTSNKLLEAPWPKGMVLVGRSLYFVDSFGAWSFHLDDHDLVQLHQDTSTHLIATDGQDVYWGSLAPGQIYRYQPGSPSPMLLVSGLPFLRGILADAEFVYVSHMKELGLSRILRIPIDGTGVPEPIIPVIDDYVYMAWMDDLLLFHHVQRNKVHSFTKAGPAMPPPSTPSLREIRTTHAAREQQYATTYQGIAERTPTTGELTPVWTGNTTALKAYTVDVEHLFVFQPDRIVCVTR